MMIAIAFEFDANRYHATQWGRHVNEGVPEWPPSPWRILRALVAVWRRTLPQLPANQVVPILEQLAAPPSFYLPPAAAAHTRHYMPVQEGRSERRTLVLDSFVATQPGEPLSTIWPQADLTLDQRNTLRAILDNLTYLGRAEAWCTARLMEEPPLPNCSPLGSPTLENGDDEVVRVLLPRVPLRLVDLCAETSDLRGRGQIDPPGARWHLYTRQADAFARQYPSTPTLPSPEQQMGDVVRYALAGKVMSLVTDTMRVAELMRRSAMSKYGGQNNRAASETLSGKDSQGEHLKDHQHAFYLPTDEDQDGYLDHLTVWAPGGLNTREVDALARVDTLTPGQDRPEVHLALLGYGWLKDFRQSDRMPRHHPIFGSGRVWRSTTPFVLVRHPKKRKDGPADQVILELERHNFPVQEVQDITFTRTITPLHYRQLYPLEFYRWRRGGQGPAGGAYAVRVTFHQEVNGPLALGYGCHFGLGQFVPIESEEGGTS